MIVDLFRGPGGWSEGLELLGLTDYGVENDPAAHATATAAGHDGILADVRTLDPLYLLALLGYVDGIIASPPCTSYTLNGHGHGRRALDDARLAVNLVAHGQRVPDFGDATTPLVVEPLRWALELEPEWLAWEQVPSVLPVWEACADVLRADGYDVTTGHVNAEDYGVPQTRKRAILVAHRSRPARLPEPVTATPVSMGAALNLDDGRTMIPLRGAGRIARHGNRPGRTLAEPSFTITGGNSGSGHLRWRMPDGTRAPITLEERALLQTFRPGYPWTGRAKLGQVSNAVPPLLAAHIIATLTGVPAPRVADETVGAAC